MSNDRAVQARILRWSVAFVWFMTGVLVVHPHYRGIGTEYLGRAGLPIQLMYLACAAEVVLAVRLVWAPMGRWLAGLQIGLMLFFTAVLGVVDPMLFMHPLGVLSKNLPLMVVVLVAWRLERNRWDRTTENLLRMGMAVIWFTEGLFPKMLFQQAWELSIVTRLHMPVDPSGFFLFMGAAQIASSIAALLLPAKPRRWVLWGQFLALLVLPLMVGVMFPDFWFHPFGPFTKNVPILVGTYVLIQRLKTQDQGPA